MTRYLALILVSTALTAAEPSPPPCQFIQPEKLIVHEDGSRELAATTVKFHGEWKLAQGVIHGVHGNEKHLATLRFNELFENCVITFRIRFVDPGRFAFVAGAHGLDVAFSASSPEAPAPVKIKGRKPGQSVDEKAQVLTETDMTFKVGEWINVLIEHTGDQVRVKIGENEMTAVGGFRYHGKEKKEFYLNAGDQPGTRVEFDDILCWSGTSLKP